MSDPADTAAHYAPSGLLDRITDAAREAGLSVETLTVDALGPMDEFHVGGRPATRRLADGLDLGPSSRVLDIGSGIGGTARFLAAEFGCAVAGVDLTADYVDAARQLSDWSCPDAALEFHHSDAGATPFADASFDRAVQLHVGMNIADKDRLFREIFRVLEPGGRYLIYDLMGFPDAALTFPLPWASDSSMSHLAAASEYVDSLVAAGFTIEAQRDHTDSAQEAFAAQGRLNRERGGPPPLGLQVLLGADAPTKLGNLVAAIRDGIVAPVELICTKPRAAV